MAINLHGALSEHDFADIRGEYFNVRVYFLDRECNTNQTAN